MISLAEKRTTTYYQVIFRNEHATTVDPVLRFSIAKSGRDLKGRKSPLDFPKNMVLSLENIENFQPPGRWMI
jgi:hypothetical protein